MDQLALDPDPRWDLVELPDDDKIRVRHDGRRERHYMVKAACSCGWGSCVYRYWGQARGAGLKHEQASGHHDSSAVQD